MVAGVALLAAAHGGVSAAPPAPPTHLRVNLAGYGPSDRKVAVLFAERPLHGPFTVRRLDAAPAVLRGRLPATSAGR
jgi:hypothetical protein